VSRLQGLSWRGVANDILIAAVDGFSRCDIINIAH